MTDVHDLLTPAEVAKLFRVDPKTVTRWGKAGKLRSIRTPGGHRRYNAGDVYQMLGLESDTKPKPRCYRCGRTDGDIVPTVPTVENGGQTRHMHAYGKCPS